MRILNLTSVSVPATATSAQGTATDFSASPARSPFNQGASAVAVIRAVGAASATAHLQVSTDGGSTYADAVDDTGTAIAPAFGTAVAQSASSYFNVKSIGQLMRLNVVSSSTAGAGAIQATLIQN